MEKWIDEMEGATFSDIDLYSLIHIGDDSGFPVLYCYDNLKARTNLTFDIDTWFDREDHAIFHCEISIFFGR